MSVLASFSSRAVFLPSRRAVSIGSAVNNGNGGSSFVNLRGLGSNRNLVLLDGNRLVPADLRGQFDLNNIPVALLERVDVLTGGASSVYGADAVAGVVKSLDEQTREATVELTVTCGDDKVLGRCRAVARLD